MQDISIAKGKTFKGYGSILLEVNMYKISLWKLSLDFVISMLEPWVLALFLCVILLQNLPTWPMDNHG